MFSKACEYAIKAIVFIAKGSLDGRRSNLKEIAKGIESPEAFTAKILQLLVKNQFIYSQKGAHGGFEMEQAKIKSLGLMAVVLAVDGDNLTNRCVLGLKQCSGINPCPFHEKYSPVRMNLIHILETTTIYDLAVGLISGRTSLKE